MPEPSGMRRLSQQDVETYLRGLKPERRPDFDRYARAYLAVTGGDTSKAALERFRAYLQARYKPSSVQFIFGVVRRLFVISGAPWPYLRGEGPKVPKGSEFRPIRDQDVIRELIAAARSPKVARLDRLHLAMATTYGLRRGELAMLTPSTFRVDKRQVYLRRLKDSVSRWHVLPEVLVPVVQSALGVLRPVSLDHMDRLTRRLERWAGIPHACGVSWHAIRRALLDGLMAAGVPDRDIAVFMGWQTSEHRMVARYAAGVVVDRQGRLSVPLSAHERAADEVVLASHPFLSAWS